ncbi:MAG: glycosyltransferase [Candidatus Sulfotelmatobacter sp.]
MITVAYLANCFPVSVEPYVGDEIHELQRRGIRVVAGSVRKAHAESPLWSYPPEVLHLQPLRIWTILRAVALATTGWKEISGVLGRVLMRGDESLLRRWKALLHTGLGAYYAVQLQNCEVDHIHVHHGYFGSWIAMVAAQLLGVSYSLTLHGSDLLVHGTYLDTKLKHCRFCTTISEYNRRYILESFPGLEAEKVNVSRLGVDVPERVGESRDDFRDAEAPIRLLAVGRLHRVKDQAFLIRACARLRDCGLKFDCVIAGDGPERDSLVLLIREKRIEDRVTLLGHVPTGKMDALYRHADAVVLTSRSEGIPLVLMEAMARSKPVLAPAITGIPELVIPGKTGFLYAAGDTEDFLQKVFLLEKLIRNSPSAAVGRLDWIVHAARLQILHNYDRTQNLSRYCDQFLDRIAAHSPR